MTSKWWVILVLVGAVSTSSYVFGEIPESKGMEGADEAAMNYCMWKGDTAIGVKAAIVANPKLSFEQHRERVWQVFRHEGYEDWYIEKVLIVFEYVIHTMRADYSDTRVFVETYNTCIKHVREMAPEDYLFHRNPLVVDRAMERPRG